MRLIIVLLLFLFIPFFGQEIKKKEIIAKKISSNIKIDGVFDEEDWKNAEVAKDFIEFYPDNGKPENPDRKSFVKILYDDNAIYIAAELYDTKSDSIMQQLAARDEVGQADFFLVTINPYNDSQQDFEFLVTAAGAQYDAFITLSNGEDGTWDAVWDSAVKITDKGWQAEFKIPYSALRFPKKQTNEWAINFHREVKWKRKRYTWNFVNRAESNNMRFAGKLKGIENINPPTRLFFIPYASAYVNTYDGETETQFKAGADIKWGINDSFTLDAILIPDFGQTAFDNVQYVLGPFEQQFGERRPFFTEGFDLFNKGNLLYTRRIGQIYSNDFQLNDNESVEKYPANANLLNAIKVSGRNAKGLGIGVMNAVTEKTDVNVKNSITNETYEAEYSPMTNYNVVVFDKRFGNNNSIAFVNTNVLRSGNARDANVTALLGDFYTKNNKYNISNEIKFSQRFDTENTSGFWIEGSGSKTQGKHRFGSLVRFVSKDYNINDLGINFYRNYNMYNFWYNYRILESNKRFNSFNVGAGSEARFNNETHLAEGAFAYFNVNVSTKKDNYLGFGLNFTPITTYDHYEPRTQGRYMKNFRELSVWLGSSPNYNKRFVVDIFPGFYVKEKKGMFGYYINFSPRFRWNDHFLLTTNHNYDVSKKNYGYVNTISNDIIIGQRDQLSVENSLNATYNFNTKISLQANLRHYWTTVSYDKFFTLLQNGDYEDRNSYKENHDFSYNNWNVDFSFSWWFAPGSQLTFLYRNSLDSFEENYNGNYRKNIENLFAQPQSNTFSLRITYFLDYNKIKNFKF